MATAQETVSRKDNLMVNAEISDISNGPHHHIRRKSGMLLELRDYDDDDCHVDSGNSSRRPSTSSLSRYRSCPQLASALTKQDSPGSDMQTINEPTESNSPDAYRRFPYADDSDRSSTPTPPSSPGSRRSNRSFHDNSPSGWDPSSASSTPKLNRRAHRQQKYDRLASTDSAQREINLKLPLREDNNVFMLDKRRDRDSKTFSDLFDSPPEVSIDYRFSETSDDDSIRHHGQNHVSDDGHDKCERWLQTLKLSKADRIKSRSQMHLPPVL